MATQNDDKENAHSPEEFNRLKKEAQNLLRPYLEMLKLTPKELNTEALEQIRKLLPDSASLAKELESLATRLQTFSQRFQKEQQDRFDLALADFIRSQQSGDPRPREVATAKWRIGHLTPALFAPKSLADRGILDIESNPRRQCVRIEYDGEKLLPWSPVTKATNLEATVDKAYRLLESQAIPVPEMVEIFANAYARCEEQGSKEGKGDPGLVPILEFHHEVRLEMTRRALVKLGPSAKIPFPEFPKWAFQFNLDRYQVITSWEGERPRLSLEIGTQSTIRQGHCLLVGCQQSQGHRQCCFIKRVHR